MKIINMNDMAVKVAYMEKGKVEVNIAQIKEVLKCFLLSLSEYDNDSIIALVRRYDNK
jgi:hypothetical protein